MLLSLILSCRAASGGIPASATPSLVTGTVSPSPTPLPPSRAADTATASATAGVTASATQPATPTAAGYRVQVHPEGGLYVGDQVSFEVIGEPPEESQASIEIAAVEPVSLGPAKFGSFGIARRSQATFLWAWDTSGLAAGVYTATIRIQGATSHTTWDMPLALQPAGERQAAQWTSVTTECCVINYITGTASERDIERLAAQADAQARSASRSMEATFSEPLTVTLLSRVLGHGGFASDEISISYLDRNYAGDTFSTVLHHEMIHILDASLGGNYRPSLFVEGLAVYMTGGHFKPEPLRERAAALLQIEGGEWYIPIEDLANDFYASQHEIGYLQGGALIDYMVRRWGWAAFSAFYRQMETGQDQLPAAVIDAALREHLALSLGDLEADFLHDLQQQRVSTAQREDLRLTVIYYDTLRHYQQTLDSSAYFATAWLLDGREMRRRGIVADYLRHPNADENLALETLLMAANTQITRGEFALAEAMLQDVENVLAAIETGQEEPFTASWAASEYLSIVRLLRAAGYEAQQVWISGDQAEAQVSDASARLLQAQFQRQGDAWALVAVGEPTSVK
ncbi:MAG: hypothetical protein ACOYYS_08405 [Chloroflexota bacterium]